MKSTFNYRNSLHGVLGSEQQKFEAQINRCCKVNSKFPFGVVIVYWNSAQRMKIESDKIATYKTKSPYKLWLVN